MIKIHKMMLFGSFESKIVSKEILLLIIQLICFCSSIYSQKDTVFITPIDSFILEEIELKAQKIYSTDINQTINVDNEKLASIPQIDQFLNNAPGIEMQIGALNTNRINIRGIGSRSPFATSKLKAYLDDIPLTDGVGETSLEDLNLSIIEKLELIKGPNSSLYGGTLGGTILFKTKNTGLEQSESSISTTIGSYGLNRINSDVLKIWNDKAHSTYINAEYLDSDGYRDNNEYAKLSSSIIHKVSGKDAYWTVLLNLIKLKSEIPSSINLEDFNNNPRNAAFNWSSVEGYEDNLKLRMGVSYSKYLSTHSSVFATGFGSFYNAYEFRPFNVLDDDSRSIGFRGRYMFDKEQLSITIGTEWTLEKYRWMIFESLESGQGNLLQDNKSKRSQYQLFSQFIFKWPNGLGVFGGLNINTASFNIDYNLSNESTEKPYDNFLLPRVGLSYQGPNNNVDLKMQISRGLVYPGLDESLDPDGLIIQSLEPEKGINYELSTNFRLSDKIKFGSTLFLMYVNDILVNRQDQNGQSFALNAGKTRHLGIEPTINIELVNKNQTSINLELNGSFGDYKFTNFVSQASYNGNQLTGVAANKFNLTAIFLSPILSVKTSLRYTSSIPVDDANSIFNESYYVQRIHISKSMVISSQKFDVSFSIDNLWNTKYASMISVNPSSFGGNAPRIYYPGLPRNYMFGIKYIFQ